MSECHAQFNEVMEGKQSLLLNHNNERQLVCKHYSGLKIR